MCVFSIGQSLFQIILRLVCPLLLRLLTYLNATPSLGAVAYECVAPECEVPTNPLHALELKWPPPP